MLIDTLRDVFRSPFSQPTVFGNHRVPLSDNSFPYSRTVGGWNADPLNEEFPEILRPVMHNRLKVNDSPMSEVVGFFSYSRSASGSPRSSGKCCCDAVTPVTRLTEKSLHEKIQDVFY